VRSVELQNCDQADWRLLHNSFRQFHRLAKLTWDHHANLPRNIANALRLHHPKAELQAKVSQMYISGPTDKGAIYRIFDHPVLAQLTSLDFHASRSEYLYPNFKQDLLDLLTRSTALKYLRIYRGPLELPIHTDYPEMLQAFGPQFPRLETLILATRTHIFTENELIAWGKTDGWSKLRHLNVARASDLCTFIAKVPQLVYLDLTADLGDGMDQLASSLEECKDSSLPLGPVSGLMYTHFIQHTSNPNLTRLSHIIPWCVIKKISTTLTDYSTYNPPVIMFYPGYAAPSTADIIRLSNMCPGLKTLRLDVRVRRMNWDPEHLTQLIAFSRLKQLTLYVHRTMQRDDPEPPSHLGVDGMKSLFGKALKLIIEAQTLITNSHKFLVDFKLVQGFESNNYERSSSFSPDFIFTSDGVLLPFERPVINDKQVMLRKKYAIVETRDLQVKAKMLYGITRLQEGERAMDASLELVAVREELGRRKRLEEKYGDSSVTLYDMWMEESEISRQAIAKG
jgi:hypothetical protein